jgi:hypothetical protein
MLRKVSSREASHMTRTLAKGTLAMVVGGLAFTLAIGGLWLAEGQDKAAQAEGPVTMGVDADPTHNGTDICACYDGETPPCACESSGQCENDSDDDDDGVVNDGCGLGPIESCRAVGVDEEFYVDVFVTNVTDLKEWEVHYFAFDGSVLEVIDRDVFYFLDVAPDSNVGDFCGPTTPPEASGYYVLGAVDYQAGAEESGEGVLVRLKLHAKAEGSSPANVSKINWGEHWTGPKLNSPSGPIGDTDGDGLFDGAVYDAQIRVGTPVDSDGDTVDDVCDNCPDTWNENQADGDSDGMGDACDLCMGTPPDVPIDENGCSQSQVDQDLDGVCDPGASSPLWCTGSDNCPSDANPDQDDNDNDGAGDACDNCPLVSDPDQTDTDDDNFGNPCDCDDDNDGIPDAQEVRDGTDPLDDTDFGTKDTNDTDSDGALNWEEDWCGSDYLDDCGDDCGGGKTDDAWSYDLNIDCWASSTDILMFPAAVKMPAELGVEPTYQCRYDLNGDNWVSSTDVLIFPARIAMPSQCVPGNM